MIEQLRKEQGSAEATSSAQKSKTAQTASSGMTRDEHMKKLSENPRFKVLKPSGKGFVIGGVKPPTDKKAEKENPIVPSGCADVADPDPPYLEELIAEVMAARPELTKDQAREMLLASGA